MLFRSTCGSGRPVDSPGGVRAPGGRGRGGRGSTPFVPQVEGAEPTATIPNGIDVDAFRRPGVRQQWRQENGFVEGDFLIASVARLEPQKNPLGLIESFAQAFENDPRRRLLLAGDGSLREAAREYSASRGVGARVHFLGVRADVAEMLSACDIFA